jgi:hypothetical protein
MKYYCAVDIEATGQFLTKNAMIALGCTIMNDKSEELDNFVGFMNVPEGRYWEKRCVDEFWSKQEETLKYIKEKSENPKDVMNKFAIWLDEMDLKYGKEMVILSDNGGYDYAWIDTYLSEFTERPSIYYRCKFNDDIKGYSFRRTWDTNSVYHGASMIKKGKYVEWNLEKELECQNEKWSNDHDPLNDARNIAANYILFIKKNQY